jgi:hypothetical protein
MAQTATGWANVGKRENEKARNELGVFEDPMADMTPEQLEELAKMQSKLTVQPVIQTDILLEIRDLLIELTNEMKYANKQIFEGYEPHYVDPRVIYDPETANFFVDIPEPNGTIEYKTEESSPVEEPPVPTVEKQPRKTDDEIVEHFSNIIKDYQFGGKRYFTDEDIGKFTFAIEEDRVLMKPIWMQEGFRDFKEFVQDRMGGEYIQDKSGRYSLPLP